MTFLRPIWRIVLSCAALLAPTAAMAEPIADFYHGKTINLYVSFPPGGGYDIYARVLLPYFSRHIPGNPSIVVKNMEGGSGVRAAGYISTVTPQDGTSLGLFLDTLTLGKVLGGPGEFDPVKLVWIGRIVSTATLAMVWHTSAVQSIEEAKQRQIIIAASVPSNSSSFIPTALNDLIGTKFKIVRGFPGSPPMALAMERGEVDAIGGMSWEAIQLTKTDWLGEKKARGLYTHGAARIKDLPDVPGLLDLAVDDKSRRILGPHGRRAGYRPFAGRRARHPGRARRRPAPGLHGHDGRPGIRRRHAQAQPRGRAVDRRGGAEDRRRRSGDPARTGRAGQPLCRAVDHEWERRR